MERSVRALLFQRVVRRDRFIQKNVALAMFCPFFVQIAENIGNTMIDIDFCRYELYYN